MGTIGPQGELPSKRINTVHNIMFPLKVLKVKCRLKFCLKYLSSVHILFKLGDLALVHDYFLVY